MTYDYDDHRNDPISVTDTLDNTMRYGYNTETGVLEWVMDPNDTEAIRTEYTYDEMYRQTTMIMDADAETALSALRSSVKIGSRTLARCDYTDDRNKYLSLK